MKRTMFCECVNTLQSKNLLSRPRIDGSSQKCQFPTFSLKDDFKRVLSKPGLKKPEMVRSVLPSHSGAGDPENNSCSNSTFEAQDELRWRHQECAQIR